MAQSSGTKTSALTAAAALTGSELVALVQGGADRRSTVQAVANRAPSQVPPVADIVGSTGSAFTAIDVDAGLTLLNNILTGIPLTTGETLTTITLTDAERGKTLITTNSSAVTLTVPPGLTHPYQLVLVQYGAGAITPVGSGGTLIHNRAGDTKTNGLYAVCALISLTQDIYVFSGDTAP